jgi:hypothetical protein
VSLPPTRITAVYQLRPSEYLAAVRVLSQRSKFALLVGVLSTAVGVAALVIGLGFQDPVTFVVDAALPIFFGVALFSGWYCVPFWWYAMRKRPDLFNAQMTFEADASGLRYQTSMYDNRIAWPYVRRVRDLGRFLFFDNGAGGSLFVPERALDVESMATLRQILGARGLLLA